MSRIGCARVSTTDQHPEAQGTRLPEHGFTQVFTDHGVRGKLASRPQWDACRRHVRAGAKPRAVLSSSGLKLLLARLDADHLSSGPQLRSGGKERTLPG
jgi:hypothetical protein